MMVKLMDEFNGPLVRLHAYVLNGLVNQVVLAIPEAAHCFDLRGGIRTSLGELDTARCEKVANAVESGFPIHIEPVVRGEIEGTKWFASLFRTLLKVLLKHLFPTRGVEVGGVRYHTVEVEEDGVVLVAGYGDRHCSPPWATCSLAAVTDSGGGQPNLRRSE